MTEVIKRYSKSIRRARAAMHSVHMYCDLCDRGNEVTWKCDTCEELLCDQCKTTHLRSRIANSHTVSTLTKYSKRERQNRDPLQCSIHTNEKFHMFCTDCQSLVCPDCIIHLHLKHPLQKISKIGAQRRHELEKCLTDSRQKLENYTDLSAEITKRQQEYQESMKDIVECILKHAEEMKSEIEKKSLELIAKLETIQENDMQKLKAQEIQIKQEMRVLEEWISKSEEDISVIKLRTEIQRNLEQVTVCPPLHLVIPPVVTYDNINLDNLIGQLEMDLEVNTTSDYEDICPDIHLRVISSFTPKTAASHVCAANGKAWFRYYSQGDLHLVRPDGKVVNTVKSDYRIHDMAVTSYGDVLLTLLGANEIHRLTKDGKFETAYNLAPYSTLGICSTYTDDILVCAANENDETAVLRLSSDNKIVQKMSTDQESQKPLFDTPMFVTQSQNGNICVSNYDDNQSFSVVILDHKGNHKNTYTGQEKGHLDHGFTSWYLQTDHYNNILVSDTANSCIHILNKYGYFVQFLFTSTDKLGTPGGMSIDSTGKLWVCTDTQSQQDDSSKVHIIQYLVYKSTSL